MEIIIKIFNSNKEINFPFIIIIKIYKINRTIIIEYKLIVD
jgi:hypothetical protein